MCVALQLYFFLQVAINCLNGLFASLTLIEKKPNQNQNTHTHKQKKPKQTNIPHSKLILRSLTVYPLKDTSTSLSKPKALDSYV